MTSISETFFSGVQTKDDIHKLVHNKQAEGLYLEFKQKDPKKNEATSIDKGNFSTALSYFANSDGGVLIYGISTTKNKDLPDTAESLHPIVDVDKFVALLLAFQKDAVQPMVDGVRIETIYEDNKVGTGYVKILIPVSAKTPHRAMENREYWKRNQQGKYRLEHFDLEDMFGRRQKPLLRFRVKYIGSEQPNFTEMEKKADADGYLEPLVLTLFVANEGRWLGEKSRIIVKLPEQKYVKIEERIKDIRFARIDDLHGNRPTLQISSREEIFYPESDTRIGEFICKFHKEAVSDHSKTEVEWFIDAENMARQTGKMTLLQKG